MGDNILKLIKPADIITLFNALLGFTSVIMTVLGRIDDALILILIAVIADGADGAFARYSGPSILGANLDSLADAISFGVAPAASAIVLLRSLGSLTGVFAGFFLACGILRLARFNVAGKKDGFEGIPITAGGLIVALFLLIRGYVPYFEYVLIPLLVLLSLLMVSTIGYPKLKKSNILAPVAIIFIIDILVYLLGYTNIVTLASLVLFVLSIIYILNPVWRMFYGKDGRSKRAG